MIRVELDGGLGNQMFQYATAVFLAEKWGTDIELDLSSFFYKNESGVFTRRNFELPLLGIGENVIQNSFGAKKIYFRFRDRLNPLKHYYEKSLLFDPELAQYGRHLHLHGYFQSEKYFSDVRDLLLRKFDFSGVYFSPDEARLLEKIREVPSVAIHIRRGDYASKKAVNEVHGTLSEDYYKEAISAALAGNSDRRLYFFSDDPDWVRVHLISQFGGEMVHFQGNDGHVKEMKAMTLASVNIIANSSFSWWGAWLNQRNQGKVFAPKVWFKDIQRQAQSRDICPQIWEKL